jgi:hypothetical protein
MKKRYVEFADIVKEQLDRALTQEDTLDEMSRVLADCIKAGAYSTYSAAVIPRCLAKNCASAPAVSYQSMQL